MSTEPPSLSGASEAYIRSVFAYVRRTAPELPPAAEVWETLSDGLDEETLTDLARRAALPEGEAAEGSSLPVTLDHTRGLALVTLDPAGAVLRLHWDGDRFAPLKDGEEPRPTLPRFWELAALEELNTAEATWERIARGRTEAELLELARQAAGSLDDAGYHGELTLEHDKASAVAHSCTFVWNEEADAFRETGYWSRSSVLMTVETLRSVCTDLY